MQVPVTFGSFGWARPVPFGSLRGTVFDSLTGKERVIARCNAPGGKLPVLVSGCLRPYKDRGKPIRLDEGNKLNLQLELIPANESEGQKTNGLRHRGTETWRRARLENERQG